MPEQAAPPPSNDLYPSLNELFEKGYLDVLTKTDLKIWALLIAAAKSRAPEALKTANPGTDVLSMWAKATPSATASSLVHLAHFNLYPRRPK
jgi:hypothetical protein